MATDASERQDNEGYKFGGTKPDNVYVKSSLTDGSGSPISEDNRLPVDNFPSSDFKINVALGLIPGTEFRSVFGSSEVDEGIANNQVLGDGMTGRYQFPSSPAQMTLVSDSADDDITGTGARVALIRGNITGNVELFESILLDGTNPVTTVNSYLRINSVLIVSVGSNGKNVGTITLKNGADLLAQVNPEQNVSRTAIYSIPAGVTGAIITGEVLAGKDDSGTIEYHVYPSALGNIDIIPFTQEVYQNLINTNISPFLIESGSDFETTGYSETDSGISHLSSLFELILVDDE